MGKRGQTAGSDGVREVQEIFLASVEGMATQPEQLVAAVNYGLEKLFDQLLRRACTEVGVTPEDFTAALEKDPSLQTALQERLGNLFSESAVEQARDSAMRREAGRHLQVLRYVLGGDEPASWVWDLVDAEERSRLRAFRRAGGDDNPELLARVQRALSKMDAADGAGFGVCEGCEGPISGERLGLIPYAERCTACQLELEGSATQPDGPRVPLTMFFEGGKPVPKEKQTVV